MRFASLNSWGLVAGRKAPAVPSLISWTDRTHTLLKRPVREQAVEVPEPGIESQVARSSRSSCREHGSLGVLEPVRESNGSSAAAPTSGRACTKERLCKYIAPLNHPEAPLISSLPRYFTSLLSEGLEPQGIPGPALWMVRHLKGCSQRAGSSGAEQRGHDQVLHPQPDGRARQAGVLTP